MPGDWKTIQQRELKARGARKKQNRSIALIGGGGSVITAGYALGGSSRTAGMLINDLARAGKAGATYPRAAREMGGSRGETLRAAGRGAKVGSRYALHAIGRNPTGALLLGGAGMVGAGAGGWGTQRGVEAYHQHKINQRRRRRVKKSLVVPWEITVVEKGTLGQASRMANMGKKGAIKAPNTKPTGKTAPGQKSRMDAVKMKGKGGKPNWANREPGPVGPLLDMKDNGFDTLHQSAGGSKSLIPTRTISSEGGGRKKSNWKLPASLGVAGGIMAGVGASVAQHETAPKRKVSKGLAQTLGKPGTGALKPVRPNRPTGGPKMARPPTAQTGAKPMTGPKPVTPQVGPPATLRPPSMMPPKPGAPQQQARPR
jgi:hypothetical protein